MRKTLFLIALLGILSNYSIATTMFSIKSAMTFVYMDKSRVEAELIETDNQYHVNITLDLDKKTISLESAYTKNKEVTFKILRVEFNRHLIMKLVCDRNCFFSIGKEMIDFGYNDESKYKSFLIHNVQNF